LQSPQTILNEDFFAQSVCFLTDRDPHLAEVVKKYASLLSGSVNLASPRSSTSFSSSKFLSLPRKPLSIVLTPPFTAHAAPLFETDRRRVASHRLQRQKTLYTVSSRVAFPASLRSPLLHELHDDAARKMLIAFKGIGNWTADIYLLSACAVRYLARGRFSSGTRARSEATPQAPSPERLEKLSQPWRPYRAVAAQLFWHHYLSKRGQL